MLSIATTYHRPPSEILRIGDEYAAYCIDEAGAYITRRMQAGDEMKTDDEPTFAEKMATAKTYSNPLEFYDAIGVDY